MGAEFKIRLQEAQELNEYIKYKNDEEARITKKEAICLV